MILTDMSKCAKCIWTISYNTFSFEIFEGWWRLYEDEEEGKKMKKP